MSIPHIFYQSWDKDLPDVIMNKNKKCIPVNCFSHNICIECYVKLYDKPCPICRL